MRLEEIHLPLGIERIEVLPLDGVHTLDRFIVDVPERGESDLCGVDVPIYAGSVSAAKLQLHSPDLLPPADEFPSHLRRGCDDINASQMQALGYRTPAEVYVAPAGRGGSLAPAVCPLAMDLPKGPLVLA